MSCPIDPLVLVPDHEMTDSTTAQSMDDWNGEPGLVVTADVVDLDWTFLMAPFLVILRSAVIG